MKKVRVFIERAKDGWYSAYLPDEDNLEYGLFGEGRTFEETISDFKAVHKSQKENYAKRGDKFTEVEFIFSYDVPSMLNYYAGKFSFAGLSKLTGVSAAQLSQYAAGYRNPSAKTTQKIQTALNAFGNELSNLQLI